MGKASKGKGPSVAKGTSEALSLLTREQFIGLARHCHFEIDRALLDELDEHKLLMPLRVGAISRYAPAHLWLLARYLHAVSHLSHPWTEWPEKRPSSLRSQDIKRVQADAADLNEVLDWFSARARQEVVEVPARGGSLAFGLRGWLDRHQVLGSLREILPMLRPDLRAGLRGSALLAELLFNLLERMEVSIGVPLTDTASRSTERPTVEERAIKLSPSEPVPMPSDEPALEPVTEDETPALDTHPIPILEASDDIEDEEETPATVDESVGVEREAVGAQRSALAEPAKASSVGGKGGLRGALARAREAAQRRSSSTVARRVNEKPKPRSTGEIPRLKQPEEHLPIEAEPEPVEGEPEEAGPTLEEQVQKLNALREKYTKSESWAKLVKLYEEGIYLFPKAEARKGVYLYIGALYERKLRDKDKAVEALEKALECSPGNWDVFLALERIHADAEDWEALLALMDRHLEASADEGSSFEVMLRRASLLGTALSRPEASLAQYRVLLGEPLGRIHRKDILTGVAQLARAESTEGKVLMEAATLLEGYWSVDAHADELIGLYEDMFDALVDTDKGAAAEVMSRMASSYQATGRYRNAFVALVRALSCNPEREDVFIRLENLAEKLNGLKELAAIYEDDFESVFGHHHKSLLGRRLAGLYQKIGDEEGERRAWQSVSDADPFDAEALMRLADLYQRAEEYPVLLETLDKLRSVVEHDDRIRLLLRIARIRTAGLTRQGGAAADALDLDAAVEALQDALASAGEESLMGEAVVEFVRELMEAGNQALAFQLAELLEQHFAAVGDYQAIIDTYELLVSLHLDTNSGHAEAGRLMTRIGQLHEEQLAQPEMAFLYYSKALRVDPQCDEALGRARDRAEEDGRWEELAALYEEILDTGRLAENVDMWLGRLARLYRDELDDQARAFKYFKALAELREDDDALDFLEGYYETHGQWDGLIEVLLTRASSEGAIAIRKTLLERAASLSLEALGDVALATRTLRRILTIDPDDAELMERLVVLYRSQGQLDELAEFLARQEELARDPATRAGVMLRRAELLTQDLEQPGEALEVLTRLRAMRPKDPHVLRLLESLFTSESRDIEAYAVLKSLYELLSKESLSGATQDGEIDQLLARMAAMAETILQSSDEAAIHYKTLLSRNPANLQAIGQLERIYEENNNWHELVEVLQVHAELMLHTGERSAAIGLLERLGEIVTMQMDSSELELQVLRKLLQLRGEGAVGQYQRMAELARQASDWQLCLEANEGFIAHLEDPVDQAAVLQEMAQIAGDEMQDKALATSFLERALDACPTDMGLLNTMAERYRRQGRHRSLADVLRRLIDLDSVLTPDQMVRHCRELSELLSKHLEQQRQATGLLEQALVIIREDPSKVSVAIQDSVRRRVINLYSRLDDHGAALGHLQELEEAFKGRGVTGETLARIYEDMGRLCVKLDDLKEAERYFLSAVEEDEASAPARLGLAEIHLEHERWPEALSLLEALTEKVDDISSARDKGRVFAALGRALSATNKASKAVEAYQTALGYDPANADAREALA